MFDQTFVDTQIHARSPWSMAASLTLQAGLVGGVLLISLLHPEVLTPRMDSPVVYVPRMLAEPALAVVTPAQQPSAPRSFIDVSPAMARYAPRSVVNLAEVPEGAIAAPTGLIGGPVLILLDT